MKKKIAVLTLAGTFLLGGATFAAGTSYYSQMIDDNDASVKAAVDKQYNDVQSQIYQSTVSFVFMQNERIKKETTDYAAQQFKKYHDERVQANEQDIQKQADQKITELQTYVDEKVGAQK